MAMTPRRDVPPFEGSEMLDGVASRVVGDIHQFFSKERLEHAATQDERLRLAHELHDGVLQTLAGIALQLETIARLLDTDPEAARGRLREVESLLATEQRELRAWIANLSPAAPEAMASADDLAAALDALCRRAEWQWGVRIELSVSRRGAVARTMGDHVYRIVQEGINNIGRHAHAQAAHVDVQVKPDRIDIAVADDGIGFPFRGRYDLASLKAQGVGPRSLKDRIATLRGRLILTSGATGSRIEISLPLEHRAWPLPRRNLSSD